MDVPFDEHAEDLFQSFCSTPGVGARAQTVRRDKTGWDFLVEFTDTPHIGPAEAAPAPLRAFVQVKSSEKANQTVRVKLSNAQRMASDPTPWFIVHMVQNPDGQTAVFGIHIWADVLVKMLKAIRKTDQAGKPLHRHKISIQCSELPMDGPEAVRWMRRTIEEQGRGYSATKRQVLETAGYENGFGAGRFTLELDDEDQFVDMLIGVPGATVKVKNFTFVENRFGIAASKPQVDLADGVLMAEPRPAVACDVRLKSLDGLYQTVLPAKGYGATLPGKKPANSTVRISTDFADFKIKSDCTVKFTTNTISESERKTLAIWQKIIKAYHCLAHGKVDIQFWVESRRLSHGVLTCEYKIDPYLAELNVYIDTLCLISHNSSEEIKISQKELFKYKQYLTWINSVIRSSIFTAEIEIPSEIDIFGVCLLYYFAVPVGDHNYCALIRRNFLDSSSTHRGCSIKFGRAEILESYAVNGSLDDARSMIASDHERVFAINETKQLSFGDLVKTSGKETYTVDLNYGDKD
jgi:hypothetical protein